MRFVADATFGRLYGTLDTVCATDHDGLLKAPGRMTVEAAQIFEKAHSISGHRRKSPVNVATIGVSRR
jgi:hypothetical protein